MTDHIAAMFVADVPPDHAAPGALRSKKRPARTNRMAAGRISGLTHPADVRIWELALTLRALDGELAVNTAATLAVAAMFGVEPRATVLKDCGVWDYQVRVAGQCRGRHKAAHDALIAHLRERAQLPEVRRGFEAERDRLVEAGRPSRLFGKGRAALLP